MTELFENPHVEAALLFTDLGHYIFVLKNADKKNSTSSKYLREKQVRAAFSDVRSDTGWLGREVIRAGYDVKGPFYVAVFPPSERTIEIITSKRRYSLIWPELVMVGAGGRHYLYATLKFDGGKSVLYRAPFPNVYDDGRICWGDNKEQTVDAALARQTLDLFFSSPFNKDLNQGKSIRRVKLETLYEENEGKKFPVLELVTMHANLDDRMRELLVEVKR
jgi:hypothetical protein